MTKERKVKIYERLVKDFKATINETGLWDEDDTFEDFKMYMTDCPAMLFLPEDELESGSIKSDGTVTEELNKIIDAALESVKIYWEVK